MFDAHEFARTLIHLRDDELIDVFEQMGGEVDALGK